MLNSIRTELCNRFGEMEAIAASTGIDEHDLLMFAHGKLVLDGLSLDRLAEELNLTAVVGIRGNLLPLEQAASRGIRRIFCQNLDDAVAVLDLGLNVIGANRKSGSGDLGLQKIPRGVPKPVLQVCLGIFAKILKHHRAVISLCELGLGHDANIIARALFESTLSLYFILKPRTKLMDGDVHLKEIRGTQPKLCPKCKHEIKPQRPRVSLKRLDTHMRCKLYLAHICNERASQVKNWEAAGLHDMLDLIEDKEVIKHTAAAASRAIGDGWVQRQEHAKCYAGVSIRNLAKSYGLLRHYVTIYKDQSLAVHGLNVFDYFRTDGFGGSLKLNLGPDAERIGAVLHVSSVLTLGCMKLLRDRLSLPFNEEINAMLKNYKVYDKARPRDPDGFSEDL